MINYYISTMYNLWKRGRIDEKEIFYSKKEIYFYAGMTRQKRGDIKINYYPGESLKSFSMRCNGVSKLMYGWNLFIFLKKVPPFTGLKLMLEVDKNIFYKYEMSNEIMLEFKRLINFVVVEWYMENDLSISIKIQEVRI